MRSRAAEIARAVRGRVGDEWNVDECARVHKGFMRKKNHGTALKCGHNKVFELLELVCGPGKAFRDFDRV